MYRVVSLHFTDSCNFNCPFCYREHGKHLIDRELFLGLPRFLKDATDQVAVGGGEPTLYPELVECFARECRDYDLTCNLTTNGYLIKDWDDEKIESFTENLTMVSVSMDRAKYEQWDSIDDFLDTCRKLRRHTLVGVNLLLDSDLMEGDNLIWLTSRLFENHLDRVFCLYPKNIPGPDILRKKNHFLYLTARYPGFYVDDLTYKILDEGSYRNWKEPCHYGKDIISIDEKGRVTGCSFSEDYKLVLEKPGDILKILDVDFEDRFSCPYLKEVV